MQKYCYTNNRKFGTYAVLFCVFCPQSQVFFQFMKANALSCPSVYAVPQKNCFSTVHRDELFKKSFVFLYLQISITSSRGNVNCVSVGRCWQATGDGGIAPPANLLALQKKKTSKPGLQTFRRCSQAKLHHFPVVSLEERC